MPLKSLELGQSVVALVFDLHAELVLAATYQRPTGGSAAVAVLIMPVRTALIDGVTVKPGDETILVRASELVAVDQPRAGDYVVEDASALRRDIVVAQLDPTRQLWTFVGRKVFP